VIALVHAHVSQIGLLAPNVTIVHLDFLEVLLVINVLLAFSTIQHAARNVTAILRDQKMEHALMKDNVLAKLATVAKDAMTVLQGTLVFLATDVFMAMLATQTADVLAQLMNQIIIQWVKNAYTLKEQC